jgi:hypothetical protein
MYSIRISLFFNNRLCSSGKFLAKPPQEVAEDGEMHFDTRKYFREELYQWMRSRHRLPLFMLRAFIDDSLNKFYSTRRFRHADQETILALRTGAIDNMTLFYACAAFEAELVVGHDIAEAVKRFHNETCTLKFVPNKYVLKRVRRQLIVNDLIFHTFLRLFNQSASLRQIAREYKIHPISLARRLVLSGTILLQNYRSYLRAAER